MILCLAAPAPSRPPSRLKPEMESQKVVVFLRERKRGAGHSNRLSAAVFLCDPIEAVVDN
jgi:hypothetical protein